MKEEIKVNDHKEWHGKYKGVPFEIVKWKREYPTELKYLDRGYTWNFYIVVESRKIIMSKKIKDPKFAIFPQYVDYNKMYPDVEMPGGITYWSEHLDSRKNKTVKLGCDYGHIWNYENEAGNKLKEYTLEEILKDVKECIEKLPKELIFESYQ